MTYIDLTSRHMTMARGPSQVKSSHEKILEAEVSQKIMTLNDFKMHRIKRPVPAKKKENFLY
jgi:hypothetical protein